MTDLKLQLVELQKIIKTLQYERDSLSELLEAQRGRTAEAEKEVERLRKEVVKLAEKFYGKSDE